jgi:SAM-dependent methyltransferase
MLPARVYDPLLPLAGLLDPLLDPPTIALGRRLQAMWIGPPFRVRNARMRERALDSLVARYAPRIAELSPGVGRREERAIDTFDRVIAEAVTELRGAAEARAVRDTFDRAAHLVDRVMYRNRAELLDDPAFDGELRIRSLDRLDRMNEAIGAYDAFVGLIVPLVERARARGVACPVVVDLASGHGGFALELARRIGAADGRARVIATDLHDEYLDIGRQHVREAGIPDSALSFLVQDALDLGDLEAKVGAPIDVVCCTQTVHHFPAGFVARMLGEAAAVARHGAIIVDGERNPFAMVLIATMAVLLGRGSLPFLHDAVVSMRRMYTEQELALIASLAPFRDGGGALSVSRGWVHPGHAWVEVS